MENDDKKLIEEYLNGDEIAFVKLVERNFRSVYFFAYRIVKNQSDAEDIIQETFVKVWKNIKKYRPEYSFKTWLFVVAKNTATDFLRKKREITFSNLFFRNENSEDENNFEETIADTEPLPDEIFARLESKERLKKLLNQLPAKYREVILLRCENDFSFDEIGKILNKPMDTVKSLHRRGLMKLGEMIK